MVNYRRNFALGGTCFFTVTLRERHSRQLTRSIGVLRQVFLKTLHVQPFSCDAIVILPDHLHTIWTLPPGDIDYPGRWKAIKASSLDGACGIEENRSRNLLDSATLHRGYLSAKD